MVQGYQTAFHGSPHIFEKFSLAEVGAGEGAADFGWGLYFTSSQGAATFYTGDLGAGGSPVPAIYEIDGIRTRRGTPEQKAADLVYQTGIKGARRLAKEMVGDALLGLEWTQRRGLDYYQRIQDVLEGIASVRQVKKTKGVMYEVVIPTAEKMIDWDGPVDQNLLTSPSLQTFYDEIARAETGQQLYRSLARAVGSFEMASKTLQSAGVLGIAYRGDQGHGVRNFVVFDEAHVAIVRASMGKQCLIQNDAEALELPELDFHSKADHTCAPGSRHPR